MDPMEIISAAVKEWDEHEKKYPWGIESLNEYISRHESTFETFGKFTRGLRVKLFNPNTGQPLAKVPRHETMDGVLGIVSLNIYILRLKINPTL